MEIFWEVDYAACPEGERTDLRNRPQRRPKNGVPVPETPVPRLNGGDDFWSWFGGEPAEA